MTHEDAVKARISISKTPVILCGPAGAAYLVAEGRRLVCIVRHGQTDWNTARRLQGRENVPLNDEGRLLSVECAKVFARVTEAGLSVAGFFTSPLERAKETAELISSEADLGALREEELLLERDYGTLSGLTLEERQELRRRGVRGEGIESVGDTAARMKKALASVVSRSSGDGATVVVTHGGMLNALFSQITRGRIGTGKNFSENCGVSLVAYGDDATIPLAYGLTGDLFENYVKEYLDAKRALVEKL